MYFRSSIANKQHARFRYDRPRRLRSVIRETCPLELDVKLIIRLCAVVLPYTDWFSLPGRVHRCGSIDRLVEFLHHVVRSVYSIECSVEDDIEDVLFESNRIVSGGGNIDGDVGEVPIVDVGAIGEEGGVVNRLRNV